MATLESCPTPDHPRPDVHDSSQNLRIQIQYTLGCYNHDVSWQYWVFWKSCTLCNIIHNNFLFFSGRSSVCPIVHSPILSQEFFQDFIIFWSFWIWKDFLYFFVWFVGFWNFLLYIKTIFFFWKRSVSVF